MNPSDLDLPPPEVIRDAPASIGPPVQTGGGISSLEKRCPKCRQVKPASEYSPNENRKSKLSSHCKNCRAEYSKNRYAKQPEKERARARAWYAKHKIKRREIARARRHANQDQYNAHYRARYAADTARIRAQCKKWRHQNAERLRPLNRALSHRRRALQRLAAGASYTTAEHIAARWEMFGGRCWVCGRPAKETDHMIALIKGGSHWPSNLRPICKRHNSAKRERSYKKFLALRYAQPPLPLP